MAKIYPSKGVRWNKTRRLQKKFEELGNELLSVSTKSQIKPSRIVLDKSGGPPSYYGAFSDIPIFKSL